MPLSTGTRLGPYTIEAAIGAGGMGEVYKAHDARLGRDVAIKVLPPTFASDPDRLSRFEQEARAAAALNHPNIAAVHDVGVEGTTRYIVQEYLSGTTLRQILKAQPSKPLREWIAIAAGVADALAAAHRGGIVHRDIKPENIIVTDEGRAKVLDFGLAKLTDPGADAVSATSPTVLGTMAGAVMGTVGYMSPEQAAGQPADRRTDIFALGCVLYEMVSGRPPFDGRSAAEIIAHVLHDEPVDLHQRSGVPRELARVIHKCLLKDPARRYQHADDLAVDLRDAERVSEPARASVPNVATAGRRAVSVWWLGLIPVAIAAAVILTRDFTRADVGESRVVRFEIPMALTGVFNRVLAVSPDGRFTASTTSRAEGGLVVRWLDRLDERALDGTTGARDPAVSPDSRQIVFWSNDQVRRVPVDGGPVVSVGSVQGRPLGLSWGADGFIYVGRGAEGLWRLPSGGGALQRIKAVQSGQYAHGPQLLPGGDWVLFTRASRVNGWNDAEVVAARMGSDEERVLVHPGHDARWVPGYLMFVHDSQLFAMPFDAASRSTSGQPALIADGLLLSAMDTTGAAFYAVSDTGVLAYVGGPDATALQMVWREDGRDTPLPIPPGRFSQVRVSPNGRRAAARVYDNGWNIWLYDVDRPTGTKVTTTGSNRTPMWSVDGEFIYYASDARGTLDIWRRRADLGGPPELVYGPDGNQIPVGLTPDGTLVFVTLDPGGSTIGQVNPSRPDAVKTLVDRPTDAPEAALTRDGRLLAYQASTGDSWQIRLLEISSGRQWTAGVGFNPAWSPDGSTLMAQIVSAVQLIPLANAQGLSTGGLVTLAGPPMLPGCCDIVSRTRILALKPISSESGVVVVVNWPAQLREPR